MYFIRIYLIYRDGCRLTSGQYVRCEKVSQVTVTSSDIVICLPLPTEAQEIDMTLKKKKPTKYHSIERVPDVELRNFLTDRCSPIISTILEISQLLKQA